MRCFLLSKANFPQHSSLSVANHLIDVEVIYTFLNEEVHFLFHFSSTVKKWYVLIWYAPIFFVINEEKKEKSKQKMKIT